MHEGQCMKNGKIGTYCEFHLQYIPKSSREARMHSCSRKHNVVTKGGSVQKRKMRKGEEQTSVVEVVTSAQAAMLAAWSRIAARAVQPKAVNSRALRTSESFLPQASGKINLKEWLPRQRKKAVFLKKNCFILFFGFTTWHVGS